MLPAAVRSASASTTLSFSELNTVLVVLLGTLRGRRHQRPRNTRYRAGATPYPNRTFTGWIAPASPGAREQNVSLPGHLRRHGEDRLRNMAARRQKGVENHLQKRQPC